MALTKKIFLTGATGFVGRNVLPKLLEQNFKVAVLSRRKGDLGGKNLTVVIRDLLDKKALMQTLSGTDAIIHLAAVVRGVTSQEFYNTNVLGTKNLLEAAKINKIKKIIYLSTDKSTKDANDYYGKTKYQAEQLIKESGLDYTVLKCPTIYGHGDKVLTKLIKLIKTSPVIFIFGSGEYKLQPVYVEDVSRVLVDSIDNPKAKNKTYYLAASKPITFIEFVDLVADKFNKKITKIFFPEWLVNFMPGALGQQFKHLMKGNTFDISAFVKDFNFVPKTVEEGIILTIKKYEQ